MKKEQSEGPCVGAATPVAANPRAASTTRQLEPAATAPSLRGSGCTLRSPLRAAPGYSSRRSAPPGRCHGFFFQAEDGIRDHCVTGVQTCALPILLHAPRPELEHRLEHVLGPRRLARVGRSEERRVGKECRSRWAPCHEKRAVRGALRRGGHAGRREPPRREHDSPARASRDGAQLARLWMYAS